MNHPFNEQLRELQENPIVLKIREHLPDTGRLRGNRPAPSG